MRGCMQSLGTIGPFLRNARHFRLNIGCEPLHIRLKMGLNSKVKSYIFFTNIPKRSPQDILNDNFKRLGPKESPWKSNHTNLYSPFSSEKKSNHQFSWFYCEKKNCADLSSNCSQSLHIRCEPLHNLHLRLCFISQFYACRWIVVTHGRLHYFPNDIYQS
jgi:hypothetical protein